MMFKPSLSVLLIVMLNLSSCLFIGITGVQSQRLPPNEVSALKEIAMQLGKKDWDYNLNPCDNNSICNTPVDVGSRYNNGVECKCSFDGVCHVVSIYFTGQDLTGVLPKSLAKLPSIKSTYLGFNYLNGTIPGEWASTKLEILAVTGNRLSGSPFNILGNITSLEYLYLDNNRFSGKLPAELGKLVNLARLVLSANNFTGELPKELNRLTNLSQLWLGSNNFSGKIPYPGNCTKLQILSLQGGGLEGPIPPSISLLKNLTQLLISDLYGKSSQFPDLSYMTNMQILMLRSCNISGTIPDYIPQMSKLHHLDLSFNNLEGRIPDLEGLRLEKMYLTGNSFCGSVPEWITNRYDQREVDLSYNRFSEKSVPQDCHPALEKAYNL